MKLSSLEIMHIRQLIKKLANKKQRFQNADVLKALNNKLSRQSVATALRQMVQKGELIREGAGRHTFYASPENRLTLTQNIKRRLQNKKLSEDQVLTQLKTQQLLLQNLKNNVDSIFAYSFLEMLNNAIEHSKSKFVEIEVAKSGKSISFEIKDFGVGAFKNVMRKRRLHSELEAIQDLLKGKTTTDPKSHSGEGIFFTSKVADVFVLESYGYKLTIDNIIKDVFLQEISPLRRGTRVLCKINLSSKKSMEKIFKKYQSDPEDYAFDKTEVLMKLYTSGTIYLSRSQARRVLTGLDKFKTVILDFENVETIGQAFADEIFRVFVRKHSGITITPINTNAAVQFMIDRASKTRQLQS